MRFLWGVGYGATKVNLEDKDSTERHNVKIGFDGIMFLKTLFNQNLP